MARVFADGWSDKPSVRESRTGSFGTTMWENKCAACILHDAAIRYLVFVSFDVRDGRAPSFYDSPMVSSLIVLSRFSF
jgi:hypothetical protein